MLNEMNDYYKDLTNLPLHVTETEVTRYLQLIAKFHQERLTPEESIEIYGEKNLP